MESLLGIEDKYLPAFVQSMKQLLLSKKREEQEGIIRSTIAAIGVDRAQFEHAQNIAAWFVKEFFPYGDAETDLPGDIVDDMVTHKIIPSNLKDKCVKFISAIRNAVKEDLFFDIQKEKTLHKGAPKILSLETAVDFRAVFKRELKFGGSADSYTPECIGVAPAIEIKLLVDGGDCEDLRLQCDIERLKSIREAIDATLKELDAATRYLKLAK